jgi:hypothetical protein
MRESRGELAVNEPKQTRRGTISEEQFQHVLRRVGTGATLVRALREIHKGRPSFLRYLLSDPARRAQYEYARKWGKRKHYSKIDLFEALDEVSTSNIGFRAALAKRGVPEWRYQRIIRWTRTDPELREAYLSAKRAQQMLLVEGTKQRFWDDTEIGRTRRGRRVIHKAWNAVDRLRPNHLRKREAAARRAEQAKTDPVGAVLARARKRVKKESDS